MRGGIAFQMVRTRRSSVHVTPVYVGYD